MRKVINLLISLSFISLMGSVAWATDDTSPTSLTLFCPSPSSLTLNKSNHHWEVLPDWRSFDTSFITKPTTFVGAQWQGVDLGQVFCLYNNKERSDFPIVLYFDTQVPKPLSGSWQLPKGGKAAGYINRVANDYKGCAFTVLIQPKNTKSVYQQAEELKKMTPKNTQNDN